MPLKLLSLVESVGASSDFEGAMVRLKGRAGGVRLDRSSALYETQRLILNQLKAIDWPAFVETETTATAEWRITGIKIPKVARVLGIRRDARRGWWHVRLDRSAARHSLNANTPEGAALMPLLRESWKTRMLLVVVDDPDTHEILDVREQIFPDRFNLFSSSVHVLKPPPTLASRSVLKRLQPLTDGKLTEVFAAATADSCQMPPVNSCDPFLFPDDGCWARTYRMCTNIEKAGFGRSVAKVWIYGKLVAATSNHPSCRVEWDWHCAPIVYFGGNSYGVIDPALEPTGPLAYNDWRVKIAGIDQVRFTDTWVFKMAQPDEMRGPIDVQQPDDDLAHWRIQLIERIARLGQQPPYCR